MVTQGQVAVAPLHIGTRALEHGGQSLGLVLELLLVLGAQLTQDAARFTQRGAEPFGKLAKRFAIANCNGLESKRAGPAISAFSGPH